MKKTSAITSLNESKLKSIGDNIRRIKKAKSQIKSQLDLDSLAVGKARREKLKKDLDLLNKHLRDYYDQLKGLKTEDYSGKVTTDDPRYAEDLAKDGVDVNLVRENEIRSHVRKAYIKFLCEGITRMATSSEQILSKFPSLRRTLVKLMTKDYPQFTTDIKYVAPKPATFDIGLNSGKNFTLKWMGDDFQANVDGKKYFLDSVYEFQQAVDAINYSLQIGAVADEEEEDLDGMGAGSAEDFDGVPTAGDEFDQSAADSDFSDFADEEPSGADDSGEE